MVLLNDKFSSILKLFGKTIASKKFFYFILALFFIQASWIGLNNNFGTPHDERYHVGFIKLYSHNSLNPIINNQPTEYDYLGDATRTGSFFYHYFLSVPYWIADAFTDDTAVLVIVLRFCNILLVLIGLVFIKKLIDGLYDKPIVSNTVLFTLIMLPVFSFVSSGVNYDNLVFLVTTLSFYLTYKIIAKPSTELLLGWLVVNIIGSLTKFSYIPVFVVLIVGLTIFFAFNKNKLVIKKLLQGLKKKINLLLIVLVILLSSLLIERYVGNIISYGSPMPECAKVLNEQRCSNWGPWQRNVTLKEKNQDRNRIGLFEYTKTWIKTMINTTFGIYKTGVSKNPLPILWTGGVIMFLGFIAGGYLILKNNIRNPSVLIIYSATLLYLLLLFYTNYKDYTLLGAPVAIQGRYLIIALPILIAATISWLYNFVKPNMYMLIIILWFIIILQGGLITYWLSSDSVWWWPNGMLNPVNESINKTLIGL